MGLDSCKKENHLGTICSGWVKAANAAGIKFAAKTKLDINQKVYIENQPVLGDFIPLRYKLCCLAHHSVKQGQARLVYSSEEFSQLGTQEGRRLVLHQSTYLVWVCT